MNQSTSRAFSMTLLQTRHWLVVLGTCLACFLSSFSSAQQLGEGMSRSGTVGIQNATERELFSSLICTCGCPREALSTCTCGFAHERRSEVRSELAQGKSIEQIKAWYAVKYGSQALAVPPNAGSNRMVWILPVVAIVIGAGALVRALHHFRKPKKTSLANAIPRSTDRDAYDDRLDQELKDLNDE